ncbi:metal ABC transporter permease [Oceanotoga teriensis]|jgi:manganese/zinc/iron transport system permease protein|uniref:metal ABC transporter permease n=1 Tax=Oceanotoga teriensis TaxID=515440 RepID=UPI002712EAC3|nr:metal ABC transporter permease [Oceanotoga teriensis]MDO7976419.1 metal ABC transporter permease [Oceanotoga teriensis]
MGIRQIEIQLIASIVAVAASLPGNFLILRKMSMMSDAISHSILPGIVIGFFIAGSISSPILAIGAALTGVLTVWLVEVLNKSKLINEDASIGIVFPALFSIGVILITKFAGNVHLDTDAVLLGELAFAPFDRIIINGIDIGPKSLIMMSVILLVNLIFIFTFYKELKISTFDPSLAESMGFKPEVMHYALMTVVSITAVGSFEAVGSILLVALMIAIPATSYLLTDELSKMILLSSLIGIITAISGYWSAHLLDVSISGSMASMAGIIFFIVLFLSPKHGILTMLKRRKNLKLEFAKMALTIHLQNHEEEEESSINHLYDHFSWNEKFADKVIKNSIKDSLIKIENNMIFLTEKGITFADKSLKALRIENFK